MKLKLSILSAGAVISSSSLSNDRSFSSSMRILAPLEVSVVKGLEFEASLSGVRQDVVTSPSDSKAAVFSAKGLPNTEVVAKINEWSIQIVRGNGWQYGDWITVANFSYGGDLSSNGIATLDSQGELNNMRVGGTAYINSYNTQGTYIGNATFRLSYL